MADIFGHELVLHRKPPVQQAPTVDPHWKCQREGDCCSKILEVVMTKKEAEAVTHAAPSGVRLQFRPIGEDGIFVALKAEPCPLYIFKECMVYDVRPYNCRRFVCLRPDPKSETFEPDGGNLTRRTATSKVALRMARKEQNKHMNWAYKMGWPVENDDGDVIGGEGSELRSGAPSELHQE